MPEFVRTLEDPTRPWRGYVAPLDRSFARFFAVGAATGPAERARPLRGDNAIG